MALDLPSAPWADLRRVLDQPDRIQPGWQPPMDVIEHQDVLDIRLDVPGVSPASLRVTIRADVLVISGDKTPGGCGGSAAFHVAERTCGRFTRTVPLRFAFDASRIRASLSNGELRIVVPRIADRRGREIEITVDAS